MRKTFFLIVLIGYTVAVAQNCAIYLHSGDSVSTRIVAMSDATLFVDGGSYQLADVELVMFAKWEEKYSRIYERIEQHIKITFNPPDITFDENTEWEVQEVVDQSGSKSELYVRAKTWFVQVFKSAKDVIQMDNESAGKIIGKGLSSMEVVRGGSISDVRLYYTITVELKDQRYRFSISNLYLKDSDVEDEIPLTYLSELANGASLKMQQYWIACGTSSREQINYLVRSLKQTMLPDDDW